MTVHRVTFAGRIHAAVVAGEWPFLAGWVSGRFGVSVTAEWVAACIGAVGERRWQSWSDGSWAMWWKNRLCDARLLPPGLALAPDLTLYVTLHMGVLWAETEEELARLRWPDPTPVPPTVATPGIERVLTSPEPIDRTAAAVTNGGK